jgi:trimeric autotransporter adhesin
MKRLFTITALLIGGATYAQTDNVGIGTTQPDNSAILDLSSSNKGFLLPRMSETQRLEIKSPAQGLQVFQTDGEKGNYTFDGTKWLNSTAGVSAAVDPWLRGGNNILAGEFLGTINNVPLILKSNNVRVAELGSGSNMFVGYLAGNSITTGASNAGYGYATLRDNTSGTGNLAMGVNSMRSNISGNFNTAVGRNALFANTTGAFNAAFGSNALTNNTIGNSNIAFGNDALISNTTGAINLAMGGGAMYNNLTGGINIGIGWSALSGNTTGNGNLAIGAYSLNQNTTGINSVAIGFEAGRTSIGSNNIFIGYNAGKNETSSSKLYISNTASATPLIYGDFSAKFVSIGDVDPAKRASANTSGGYNLLVKGGILTEKVKVALASSADWADYVFEDSYKLMSLNDVEKFVIENNHLPNVPSASEMAENGLEIGETSKMFMEKIEELTLYLIEMNKELKTLKAENEGLQIKFK